MGMKNLSKKLSRVLVEHIKVATFLINNDIVYSIYVRAFDVEMDVWSVRDKNRSGFGIQSVADAKTVFLPWFYFEQYRMEN